MFQPNYQSADAFLATSIIETALAYDLAREGPN
jgi:hypothetical protein